MSQEINLSHELAHHAEDASGEPTVWRAVTSDNSLLTRRLGRNKAFGADAMKRWLETIIGTWGCPVLVQRYERDTMGRTGSTLLIEVSLGASSLETEQLTTEEHLDNIADGLWNANVRLDRIEQQASVLVWVLMALVLLRVFMEWFT